VVAESADPSRLLDRRTRRDAWGRQWIHPDAADRDALVDLVGQWLGFRYRQGPLLRYEWAYRDIAPKVFIEEYCGDAQALPPDLKVLCIDGQPELFSLFRRSSAFHLTSTARFLPHEAAHARAAADVDERTWTWVENSSQELARGTDLLRVDWLLTPRGPRLGELTNYPSSGVPTFEGHARLTSEQLDAYLSSRWTLPTRYQ
jgi:hypothetical protein